MGSYLPQFDSLVNEVAGVVAGLFGEPYDVYRLLPTSTGTSVVDPSSRIASNVLALFEEHSEAADLDIKLPVPLLTYTGSLDIKPYKVGDLFAIRQDSYRPDASFYTLTANRPMPRVPIFVATPFPAVLSRIPSLSVTTTTTVTQTVFNANYDAVPPSASLVVTLNHGVYSFEASSEAPASIYIGLQMVGRVREQGAGLLPDQLPKVNYLVYIPPLGFPLVENTLISTMGDQYNILALFEMPTGFYGTICIAEKVQPRAV